MPVKFHNMWPSIPLLLIPMTFVVLIMTLIRIWMFNAPRVKRCIPNYSMHVMQEPPPKYPHYRQALEEDTQAYSTICYSNQGYDEKSFYQSAVSTVGHPSQTFEWDNVALKSKDQLGQIRELL